jgi:transcriptional regulator with XRE-family HTH domain
MSAIESIVAERIRARRIDLGLSQRDLARGMDGRGFSWHQTTVAKTERAQRPLLVTELVSLAELLHTSVGRLLDLSDIPDVTSALQEKAASALAAELLNSIEDGDIPGSVLRWSGHEIWVHTTEQVSGWLRTALERAS